MFIMNGVVHRIVAIGSSHGDDQVAWQLLDRLQTRLSATHAVAVSDASQLLDYVDDCDLLVIIDACVGAGAPGTITRLDWPDARIRQRHSLSTHGFGVADALQLAEQLGRLPKKVVLFGIERLQSRPGDSLSDVVKRAMDELEEQILLEFEE